MTTSAADEELVRALYREHAEPLLAYVSGLVGGDVRRAEDIVQETLLRAWRHARELSPGTARPWLFRVARNLVVDGYRAAGRRPQEVALDVPRPAATADDDLERALLGWQVEAALRSLTPLHRQVLVELYFRDRPVADVARTLRIPEGTVRSRAYYALRALRLALEESGVTGP